MITKFLLKLKILPRWVIIVLDLFIIGLSTFIGYLLRFNFNWQLIVNFNYELGLLVNGVSCLIALLITRSYAGIVRYTGLKDGLRVFYALLLSHSLTLLINLVLIIEGEKVLIPTSVVAISFLTSFVLMFQYRLLIKNIFSYYRNYSSSKKSVAIFGAGQMGIITKHLIDDDSHSEYKTAVFFEDDFNKVGKEINGTVIHSFESFDKLIFKYNIKELIIAIQRIPFDRKNEIVDKCLQSGLKVRNVPSLNNWIQGELSLNQIKTVNIEDLLERDSIKLNNSLIKDELFNKVIMITGAAGSIGSEIVKQVLEYKPKKLILIDQSESSLYELQRDLGISKQLKSYLVDITNYNRIERIFFNERPEILYHAAAYKHVPFMELNVEEAFTCNVLGTRNIATLASLYGVSKFVMVSTDKAVNPTNIMGCTKRLAEMYVQSLNYYNNTSTRFITTRFGNVLGSNGSVIPYFKKQIKEGGPVTVTHPEINRYFMTIGEACELVIEAGAMGNGGEIFLFDMGKSIKIVDLAKKMIKLSGFEPIKDIPIIFTGLRKGEKLYEELLADKENSLPTHHDKIMIAKVKSYDLELIDFQIKDVEKIIKEAETASILDEQIRFKIKQIVPEYTQVD